MVCLFGVTLVSMVRGGGCLLEGRPLSRRQLVQTSILVGGSLAVKPDPATAARGAAELDFEFYVRDLVGGNKKEGNIQASAVFTMRPPRTLSGGLLPMLLDERCSPSCIPCQALIEQVQLRTGQDYNVIAQDIEKKVQDLRERSSRSFRMRAPWLEERVSDQYYFDFTSYALWRVAADLLPDYLDRDKFLRRTGQLIYQRLLSEGLIKPLFPSKRGILTEVIQPTYEVLEAFKTAGFCKDYRIRGDDSREASDPVFDELDDESLVAGGTVDCLVSVFEPATLGASLQITGEQSRFGPDFVGSTLAALWDAAGIKSSWETFFVDPEYRPNPKDYFPNEQLLQYTLIRK
jgi:hypothetical protein